MRSLIRLFLWFLALAAASPAATLVSKATGNFTAAGTWGVGEAGASAIQTTRSANTNTTTSYVYSSAFTCTNLDVVDGILVYGRQLTVTGTVSVALSDDNGTTATRELAVNATDLNTNDSTHFFLFASTLTCDGGTDYKVGIKGSSAANATFYRDGTAGNWFRVPRITTTAAPGASDLLYINGDLTGAGTGNSFTVTMDNTATTSFGTTAATSSVGVGVRGTLTWGVVAATNYYLKVAGLANVFGGGTWNMGTSVAHMPSDSTAVLEFNSAVNVDSGLVIENGGTFGAYGLTKTNIATLLNTDEAAASTVIGLASTSGWVAGDSLGFASTTQTYSQYETKDILTVDSGVQVTLTAGLTNAHSGTSPTQAEVVNLTQNVKIRGVSVTLQGYINVKATASFTASQVEIYQLGSNTAAKRGIDTAITSGTFSLSYCSLHDFRVSGSVFINDTAAKSGTWTVNQTIFYRSQSFLPVWAASSTGWTFTNNTVIGSDANSGSGGAMVLSAGATGTFTGNTITSANDSCVLLSGILPALTFSGNTIHSCSSIGLRMTGALTPGTNDASTLTSTTIWRNAGVGLNIEHTGMTVNFSITTMTLFGNATASIRFTAGAAAYIDSVWSSIVSSGDSTFATPAGLGYNITGVSLIRHRFVDSTFGVASGIKVAHSTTDFNITTQNPQDVVFDNCNLASTTPVTGQTSLLGNSYLAFGKYGQVAATHRTLFATGTVQLDSTTFHTAAPSQRLTPNHASNKLVSAPWRVPVNSGGTVAASVWVRKSTAGDSCSANYGGAVELRLVLKQNSAAGIAADTVLDTGAAAIGNWEQLTGTTAAVTDDAVLEFVVDGATTTGCFYVDDWAPAQNDPSGEKYWLQGLPGGQGGGGSTSSGGPSGYIARVSPWIETRKGR